MAIVTIKPTHLAMCWKCCHVVLRMSPDYPGARVVVGCTASGKVHSFDDAQKHCPLLTELEVSRVALR